MDKASKRGNTISNQMRQGIAKIVPSYAILSRCFPVWHGTASFIGVHRCYAHIGRILISVRLLTRRCRFNPGGF